eukprot:364510-Chlamydomonas_euryale.AAC.14
MSTTDFRKAMQVLLDNLTNEPSHNVRCTCKCQSLPRRLRPWQLPPLPPPAQAASSDQAAPPPPPPLPAAPPHLPPAPRDGVLMKALGSLLCTCAHQVHARKDRHTHVVEAPDPLCGIHTGRGKCGIAEPATRPAAAAALHLRVQDVLYATCCVFVHIVSQRPQVRTYRATLRLPAPPLRIGPGVCMCVWYYNSGRLSLR